MAGLRYHPEAKHEIREAADFYERRRSGLGKEFLAELEAVVGKIRLNPRRCGRISGVFRCCRTRRFPYGIIYAIEEEDQVFVAAVAHDRRKPEYWRSRSVSEERRDR